MKRNTILLVVIGIVAIIIAYYMMNSETIDDVIEEVCIAKDSHLRKVLAHDSAEESRMVSKSLTRMVSKSLTFRRQLCKKDMQELVKLMKNYGIKDSSDIKKVLRCHIKPEYIQCILDIGISPLKLYPFVAAVVARNATNVLGLRFAPLLDKISKNPLNYLASLY